MFLAVNVCKQFQLGTKTLCKLHTVVCENLLKKWDNYLFIVFENVWKLIVISIWISSTIK